MSTITELMEGKKPGEVKLTYPGWGLNCYFIPHYTDGDYYYGLGEAEKHIKRNSANIGWTIYQEPPKEIKKIKKWLWATENGRYYTDGFYPCPSATIP